MKFISLYLRNNSLFLFSLLFLNFFLFPLNKVKSEESETYKFLNLSEPLKNKKISYSLNSDFIDNNFNYFLNNNLQNYSNSLINYLTQNPDTLDKSEVEIVSDKQYQKDGVFFAEGNVILYFSDAELRGDNVSFDRTSKDFVIEGNVSFKKRNQYFEASKLFYNLEEEKGYIDNVYGVLDVINLEKDLELNSERNKEDELLNFGRNKKLRNLDYISSSTFGLENDFEAEKRFNISDISLDFPTINKWRFKSDKIFIDSKSLKSSKVILSNDPFNKPQFKIKSINFSVEIVKDKIKIIGRNNWIILDNKLTFPIGRWTIFDKDPISRWTIGSDYNEKDGFYLSRTFDDIKVLNKFKLSLTPYFLIQRSINGYTNSFREKNSSILSDKVKNQNSFGDIFSLDTKLYGKLNEWDLEINNNLNTFNTSRFSEALRSKTILKRSYDLNSFKKISEDLNSLVMSDNNYSDFLDIQFYSVFREKVSKGYEGEEEIYFGNGLSIAQNKSKRDKSFFKNTTYLYDAGQFKAKKKNQNDFNNLFRNVIAFSYDYNIPLWIKKSSVKKISKDYKFTPNIIKNSIYWNTNIDAGMFFYSNGDSQKAIVLNTGPAMTFGNFKKNYFDFSRISSQFTTVLKSGESPFAFDDINDDNRIKVNLEQQIYGPIVVGFESAIPLDSTHQDYGRLVDTKYTLEFKRRAYGLRAYYQTNNEVFGIQFQISNFDYDGLSPEF